MFFLKCHHTPIPILLFPLDYIMSVVPHQLIETVSVPLFMVWMSHLTISFFMNICCFFLVLFFYCKQSLMNRFLCICWPSSTGIYGEYTWKNFWTKGIHTLNLLSQILDWLVLSQNFKYQIISVFNSSRLLLKD